VKEISGELSIKENPELLFSLVNTGLPKTDCHEENRYSEGDNKY
jgi:hypothetical protein